MNIGLRFVHCWQKESNRIPSAENELASLKSATSHSQEAVRCAASRVLSLEDVQNRKELWFAKLTGEFTEFLTTDSFGKGNASRCSTDRYFEISSNEVIARP